MNRLKSLYISIYLTLLAVGSARVGWMAQSDSFWIWPLVALLPGLAFFGWVFLFNVARTGYVSVMMWLGPVIAVVGMLSTGVSNVEAWIWALDVGLLGALGYVMWYSRYSHRDAPQLKLGSVLPDMIFETGEGKPYSTADQSGPLLLMFYRGNWCPLCMAQIKEVADNYKQLADKGVKLLMVSPQSHKNTAELAARFDVPMAFLVDKGLVVAKSLGIEALSGLPAGLEALGYDSDTVLPTVVITDKDKKIIFCDQTDNYRVRPEPETFLKVLNEAGL